MPQIISKRLGVAEKRAESPKKRGGARRGAGAPPKRSNPTRVDLRVEARSKRILERWKRHYGLTSLNDAFDDAMATLWGWRGEWPDE